MNDAKNSSLENHYPGRFIYKRTSDSGLVEMEGLAEAFADAVKTPNIEQFYIEKRKQRGDG